MQKMENTRLGKQKRTTVCCRKLMEKLRMKTILLLYQMCILLIALILLVICQQMQLQIASVQIQSAAKEMLDLQNKRALNIQSKEAMTVITWAFFMITQKVSHIVSLGLWLDRQNITVPQNTLECKESQQLSHPFVVPFQICDTKLPISNITNKLFFDIINTIQMHQFTFDFFYVSQQIYLVSFSKNLLTGYYPTKPINEPIEAYLQPWFINYTTQLKKTQTYIPYYLSDLYTQSNYDYLLSSFSMLMLDSKLQPIGISSLLVNFPNIQQFLYMELINIFVLHENGTLVYSKSFLQHKMSIDVHYIYQEDLTGFTLQDWEEIKYSLNNSVNPIVLHNSLLDQYVYVKAQQLNQTPLISLTLTNVTYEKEINLVLNNSFQDLMSSIMQANLYVAISAVIVILISLVPLKTIFQQAYTIIQMMMKYLNGKFDYKLREEVFSNHIVQQIQDNSLNQLFQTYQELDKKLNASQFQKSESCRLMEGFHFPQAKKIKLNYRLDELIDNKNQIEPTLLAQLLRQQDESN